MEELEKVLADQEKEIARQEKIINILKSAIDLSMNRMMESAGHIAFDALNEALQKIKKIK